MTDDELDQVAAQYPLCRRLDEDHAVILQPLTFGRWRVSRATKWAVLDGY